MEGVTHKVFFDIEIDGKPVGMVYLFWTKKNTSISF